MRFTQQIKYNLKRAIPMLAIAGAGLMASCDKDDDLPMHDVELKFFQSYYEEIQPEIIKQHAQDKYVRYIYLSIVNGGDYTNVNTQNVTNIRNYFTQRIDIAPNKIRGKGNFRFEPGVASKQDSLWFTQQGWTINQHLQNQK